MKNKYLVLCLAFTTPTLAVSNQLSPHTAYYKVTLEKADENNPIKSVKGIMEFKIRHVCDGLTIEQKSSSIANAEDQPNKQEINSAYTVWESSQDKQFQFQTTKIQNGEISSNVGRAQTEKNETTITFKSPEQLSMSTEAAITFPINFLKQQLQARRAGVKTMSSLVFDGSSRDPVRIETKIGSTPQKCVVIGKNNKSTEFPAYPIKMAVYGIGANSSTPNFIIKQLMSNDGIMCSYEINFGSHVISGKLAELTIDPNKACG